MEQAVAASLRCEGASDCRHFTAGHRLRIDTRVPEFDGKGDYILTAVTHAGDLTGVYTDRGKVAGDHYINQFECLPAAVPYRPARRTPKPVIAGLQTAVVVGTSGTDINTDAYGRVQVQFFWDRSGQHGLNYQNGDPASAFNYWPGSDPATRSCWLRVAQAWAGRNFGAQFVPRLGQEVVVGFLEGDPDRPLILGSLYNYINQPPFPLPARNHLSGIKSHSPGGSEQQYNGLSFDDQKGKEIVQIHAEKHLILNAEGNLVLNVGGDVIFNINGREQYMHGNPIMIPGFGS
jgi:type VI secretion system secreted protein VgrG